MNLGELLEALEGIRQSGVSLEAAVFVQMHPDQILNVTDSIAAIRSVEPVDGNSQVAIMISNAVVR